MAEETIDERGRVMEPHEDELQIHDEWAGSAVLLIEDLTDVQRRNLLHHIFRTAAHVKASGDKDAAVGLCFDLISTVDLRRDDKLRAELDTPQVPDRSDAVPLEKALELLRSR